MGKPEYSRWMGVEYAELVRLLDEIDRHGRKSPVSDKRVNSRFEYRSGPILFSAQHPGGTKVTTCVIGRNLSCGGMAVIYRGFLHKDTVCTIELTKLDGVKVSVQGRVRVCRHLEHMLHEIGIQFTEIVLDPKEFCAPDTRQTSSSAPRGGGGRGGRSRYGPTRCASAIMLPDCTSSRKRSRRRDSTPSRPPLLALVPMRSNARGLTSWLSTASRRAKTRRESSRSFAPPTTAGHSWDWAGRSMSATRGSRESPRWTSRLRRRF